MRSRVLSKTCPGQFDQALSKWNGLVILAGLIKLPNLPVESGEFVGLCLRRREASQGQQHRNR